MNKIEIANVRCKNRWCTNTYISSERVGKKGGIHVNADKLKQYIGLFGGLASAVFLFLHTIGIQFTWFNPASIGAFSGVLVAAIPFVLIVYGVYKNSYILTEKAKKQEKELKRRGLK
nr:phage holin [Sporosarcina aquimarina]